MTYLLIEYAEDTQCGGGIGAEDDVDKDFGSCDDLVVDSLSDGGERLGLIHLVLEHVVPFHAELEQLLERFHRDTQNCSQQDIITVIVS